MIERAPGRLRNSHPTGSPGPIAPPRVVTELDKLTAQYNRVRDELRTVDDRLVGLDDKLAAAREEDRAQFASALLKDPAGAADTGDRRAAKVLAEIEKQRRKYAALDHALALAEDAILDAVERNRDKWIQRLRRDVAEAETEAVEAERRAAAARAKVAHHHAAVAYLSDFSGKNFNYQPRPMVAA
jgi:chromosome segregation ATPase